MSRKAFTAVALLVACGVVAAMVRAQDNSGSYSIDDQRSSVYGADDQEEHSVLVTRPPIQQVDHSTDQRESGATSAAPRSTGLADRLRQVRESVTREDGASGGRLIPTQAPSSQGLPRREVDSSRYATRPEALAPTRTPASTTGSSRRTASRQGGYGSAPPAALPTRDRIPTSLTAPPQQPDELQPAELQPLERQPLERQPLDRQQTGREQFGGGQPGNLPLNDGSVSDGQFDGGQSARQPIDLNQRYQAPVDNQIRLSSMGPALKIDTVGPRSILIGKAADYVLTLSNMGAVTAKDVFVRVELPGWVDVVSNDASTGLAQPQEDAGAGQRLIWNVSQLASGGQETLRLSVTPTQNRSFDLAVDWTVRPESSLAQIEVQQPQLEMSVFGPKDILYGETAVYTIQLTNPGTGDATDVTVDFSYGAQNLPSKRVGTLAAGQQTEISVELTARQAGTLPVSAIASASSGLRAEASEEVLVRRAKLELSVAGSRRKFAGSVATYQVRVTNTGNATASDVVAKVLLPTGAKFIAGGDLKPANQGFIKRVGPLAPGAERVFAVQCQLTAPGDNRVEIHAESESELAASGSFVTRVDALADLKLRVNDPQGPTPVGTKANFEIVIENRGTKAAEDVKVVAQFSEGVEPLRAQGAVAEIVPGQVLFQMIPRIGPGEQIKLTIVAEADRAGNHRFRVETTSTEPETRLVAEESTHFFGEDVAQPGR